MIQKLQAALILFSLGFINFIFRFITVKGTWRLGKWLGHLTYYALPGRQNIVRYNLKVVAQACPEIEVSDQLTLEVFQRSAANLVCSIKTYGMTPQQLSKFVTINIHPEFKQALEKNDGAILTLAHMGNWEILSKISSLVDPEPTNFGAVYRPLDNKIVNTYVAKQRTKFGCQMFSKKTPVGVLSTFIKEGGVLGILADQRSGKAKKTARDFFGQSTPRSKLPAVLAKRTHAPLFNVSVHSPEEASWQIDITPIQTEHSLETSDIVDAISHSYEHSFRQHLVNVFWLHRYWNSGANKQAR